MTPDDLFICTVDDLADRLDRLQPGQPVTTSREYDLIMAAGLLRKLLLDPTSLVALANRGRHLRLRFLVAGWPFVAGSATRGSLVEIRRRTIPPEAPIVGLADLEPGLAEPLIPRHLKIDEMLAAPLIVWNGAPINAKDSITYVANVGGGVHAAGRPRTRGQEAIHEIGDELLVDGYPVALAALQDVGEVTLSGLRPLYAAVSEASDSVKTDEGGPGSSGQM